jgi:hypothetical protein
MTELAPEWKPCVKLPITVHVREPRPGEMHVSTRENLSLFVKHWRLSMTNQITTSQEG